MEEKKGYYKVHVKLESGGWRKEEAEKDSKRL
jgi:hypothetical protein